MTTIKGNRFLTVYAEAGGEYEIQYASPSRLSVLNATSGDVKISSSDGFTEDDKSGLFLTVPQDAAANDISMPFNSVYIKSDGSGNIVIERCG